MTYTACYQGYSRVSIRVIRVIRVSIRVIIRVNISREQYRGYQSYYKCIHIREFVLYIYTRRPMIINIFTISLDNYRVIRVIRVIRVDIRIITNINIRAIRVLYIRYFFIEIRYFFFI